MTTRYFVPREGDMFGQFSVVVLLLLQKLQVLYKNNHSKAGFSLDFIRDNVCLGKSCCLYAQGML